MIPAVDPENSAFFPAYAEARYDIVMPASSRIEGSGRPRVEPSFLPGVVDRMVSVPDAASIAVARHVSAVLGRRVGPSTGTNLWGAFGLLAEMVADPRADGLRFGPSMCRCDTLSWLQAGCGAAW
jgi:cysteine synthase